MTNEIPNEIPMTDTEVAAVVSSHRRILDHIIRTDKDRETVEGHRADIRKRQLRRASR